MSIFIGPEQSKRRIEALKLQACVLNNQKLAKALESVGSAEQHTEGDLLIKQGSDDDDILLVIGGYVELEISGHKYLKRQSGELVGEMAALEPGTRRSANVRAGSGGVTVIRVSCEDFCDVGEAHPDLWKNIARCLSGRLRMRNAYFIEPNLVPKVFIASSVLGRPVLEILDRDLLCFGHATLPWTDPDIFKPSEVPMEALEEQARLVDFAVIIATADDRLTKNVFKSWRKTQLSARDNVLLEFGLFAGALDRRRVFIVSEDNSKLGLPSDLAGLTTLRFKSDDDVAQRAKEIDRRIQALGPLHRLQRSLVQ